MMTIMTEEQFNEKYKAHLEPRFYGLEFDAPIVTSYLDTEFAKEIERNPDFTYAQIKIKFGMSRCYTSSDLNSEWEAEIDKLLKRSP